MLEESDSHVPFRMLVVNCTQVRASLREKALQLAQMLMAQVLKTTSDRNRFLCERFAEIQTELQKDLKVRRNSSSSIFLLRDSFFDRMINQVDGIGSVLSLYCCLL